MWTHLGTHGDLGKFYIGTCRRTRGRNFVCDWSYIEVSFYFWTSTMLKIVTLRARSHGVPSPKFQVT